MLKVCFEPVVKGDPTFNFTTSTRLQARSKADIFDNSAGSFVRDSFPGLVGAMPGSSIIQFYAGFPEGYPDNDVLAEASSRQLMRFCCLRQVMVVQFCRS